MDLEHLVAVGADHGGFPLKEELVAWLGAEGFKVLDLGAHQMDPDDDFPDFAEAVARAVATGKARRGLVVCGSGVGASVAANKVPGVRASICHDTYSARQGVEHDDMNVLCLGGRIIGIELARELVTAFLKAEYLALERYQRRLDKVLEIEQSFLKSPPDAG